jgi:hypothetical protein
MGAKMEFRFKKSTEAHDRYLSTPITGKKMLEPASVFLADTAYPNDEITEEDFKRALAAHNQKVME